MCFKESEDNEEIGRANDRWHWLSRTQHLSPSLVPTVGTGMSFIAWAWSAMIQP
jgi:hypothetical protein